MSAAKPSPMVVAAARELCRQHAQVCEVHKDDAWNLYSQDFIADAQKVLSACGVADLLEAARPLVAMTYEEATRATPYTRLYCRCDVLNPCWSPSYSATGWGEHGVGKHWGGGDACAECNLRAAIARALGSTP